MYATYIVKRTQIYLDEAQSSELAARARRRGTTASHVIREAVDAYLAQPESEDERLLQTYRAALDTAFGVAPHLADGAAYVGELQAADTDRATRLDERRRR
jgi:regulator of protease activity HflC (stomatin/prohibitin superfamily)